MGKKGGGQNETTLLLEISKIDHKANILQTLIRWTIGAVIMYFMAEAFKSLSGKETFTNIVVNFIGDMEMNKWVAYTLAGTSAVYGFSERLLRKNIAKRLNAQILKLVKAGKRRQ